MLYQHLGLNGHEEYLPPSPLLPPPHAPAEPQDFHPGGGYLGSLPGQPRPADPRLPPAFFDALQKGKKINAIKIYREATGVGLKEAKDYVDALEREQGRR